MTVKEMAIGKIYKCQQKPISGFPSNTQLFRAVKEDGNTVFLYGYRSRRYGHRYSEDVFEKYYTIVENKVSETEAWHKRIEKILKLMDKNQVWLCWKDKLTNLLTMTLEDKKSIYDLYWRTPYRNGAKLFDSTEWETWFQKYPFIKGVTNDGMPFMITDYIFELSDAKLKSMYFGKGRNQMLKEIIRDAFSEKKDITLSARTGYDVSFEYRPEAGKAWYSEEYRGCGNGHYYLALSENVAWFCEND